MGQTMHSESPIIGCMNNGIRWVWPASLLRLTFRLRSGLGMRFWRLLWQYGGMETFFSSALMRYRGATICDEAMQSLGLKGIFYCGHISGSSVVEKFGK